MRLAILASAFASSILFFGDSALAQDRAQQPLPFEVDPKIDARGTESLFALDLHFNPLDDNDLTAPAILPRLNATNVSDELQVEPIDIQLNLEDSARR